MKTNKAVSDKTSREHGYDYLVIMIRELFESDTDPGEVHVCPRCGGMFSVQFEQYARGERKLTGIRGWCKDCGTEIAIEMAGAPKWVQT